jgi:DNA-binding CsgD family transcriptional regulator
MVREQLFFDTLAQGVASVPASSERCAALWSGLTTGKMEVTEASAGEDRSVLIVRERSRPVRPLGARAIEVLERTFLGERRKVVAYDLEVSVSMLALTLKGSLSSVGLRCKPALVPSALVMLIHGARGRAPNGTFIVEHDQEGQRLTIVTHVPDGSVLRGLSPSERSIMTLLASGRSCIEIAQQRGRSRRTVINQVAAASRRLGVSGRFDLLHYFASGVALRRPSRVSRGREAASLIRAPQRQTHKGPSRVEVAESLVG